MPNWLRPRRPRALACSQRSSVIRQETDSGTAGNGSETQGKAMVTKGRWLTAGERVCVRAVRAIHDAIGERGEQVAT